METMMDAMPHAAAPDQAALWNGPAGQAWIESRGLLDRLFQPLEDLLVAGLEEAGAGAAAENRLLDVGCGTGSTTLAAARRLGGEARCTGIDISAPMLAVARARAREEGLPADFVCADAQGHAFEPAEFDTVISRLGVMFFGDPAGAFANLARAARPGGTMRFLAWRSAEENPFMTTAERAAAPLLPHLPRREPGAPGQFAFADRDRVFRILQEGGWSGIDIRAVDLPCTLPEGDLPRYAARMGPVGLALREADARTRAWVLETVEAAFAPFRQGAGIRFAAACWLVDARRPPAASRQG